MPQQLYTDSDMSSLTVVNSRDPVNPQDAATKHYVDDYHLRFGKYQTLWEADFGMQCASSNYGAGNTHMVNGPNDQTITKLYPDTAILVIAQMSCYITGTVPGLLKLQCSVNGGSLAELTGIYMSIAGEHTTIPVGIYYFFAPPGSLGVGGYAALSGVTGSMVVAFTIYNGSGATTVVTDANDWAAWTISECKQV